MFLILFIVCKLKNSIASSRDRWAGALETCNNWTFTTEFWNLENEISGSKVGKWQRHDYIKTYLSLESNDIVVSFFTNIISR